MQNCLDFIGFPAIMCIRGQLFRKGTNIENAWNITHKKAHKSDEVL